MLKTLHFVLNFGHLVFVFVSDLEIRISDFLDLDPKNFSISDINSSSFLRRNLLANGYLQHILPGIDPLNGNLY
jgi:hypothetical protein